MTARGATKAPELVDYVLGATTKAMAADYAGRIARAKNRLATLSNTTGGYAADLRDYLAMYDEISTVIDKYRAKVRPSS